MAIRISVSRTEDTHPSRRRRVVALVAATVVAGVLLSGVAYAFWSATGTGVATAGSATAKPLTATGAIAAGLFPTRTPAADAQALTLTLTNTNAYPVLVNSASLVSFTSNLETGAGSCPAASNITPLPGPFAVGVTVPANGTASYSIPGFVYMAWTASDNCQTKTFTFNFTLVGQQA